MLPNFLTIGDKVSIVSPAGKIDGAYIDGAVERLKSWGLNVEVLPHAKGSYGNFSGTIDERASDLQKAIDDPETKAILCSRGGYGLVQIIDKIDITTFENNPKWIIGFSDVTALHNLCSTIDTASIHSVMAKHLTQLPEDAESIVRLKKLLFGTLPTYEVNTDKLNRSGSAEGKLIGGNLSLIYGLRGTMYDIDAFSTDCILFIEDVSERAYHIDRMMNNLRLSGILENIKGLIVGQFSECIEDAEGMKASIFELIKQNVEEYDYPVIFNFPAGHVDANIPLIIGARTELTVEEDRSVVNFNCKQPKTRHL